jgi:hypothetical protein
MNSVTIITIFYRRHHYFKFKIEMWNQLKDKIEGLLTKKTWYICDNGCSLSISGVSLIFYREAPLDLTILCPPFLILVGLNYTNCHVMGYQIKIEGPILRLRSERFLLVATQMREWKERKRRDTSLLVYQKKTTIFNTAWQFN